MSKIYRFQNKENTFTWVDISGPSANELDVLAKEFGLHHTSVKDCLQPDHLPKFERHSGYHFLMLRAFDQNCATSAATVRALTRKIAIFVGPHFLVSVHRQDLPLTESLRTKWSERLKTYQKLNPGAHLCLDIMSEIFASFDGVIAEAYREVETLESRVFATGKKPFNLENTYRLKRRSSVYKRVLRLSADAISKFSAELLSRSTPGVNEEENIFTHDLKENLESTLFYAEELSDNVGQLLNLHLSKETQKTNEVMRILTVFSAFLMPPTLIAGIYGMNFQNFPELKWEYGYPASIVFMIVVVASIAYWFKRKSWL